MEKRSVLFLLCASFLSLTYAQASNSKIKLLSQDEAGNAQCVTEWLNSHHNNVDHTLSNDFYTKGVEASQKGNWSLATKLFGESMIRYPTPQALQGYIDSELRMLGQVRKRSNNTELFIDGDIKYAKGFYESARAANSILKTLSGPEEKQLQQNIDCLVQYQETRAYKAAECMPLQLYYSTDMPN